MANFRVDSPDSGQPIQIVAEKAQVTTAGNLVFTNVKNEMCAAFPQGRWRRVWKDAPVLMSAGLDRAVADQTIRTARPPVRQIEFIGDGNAVVRRADNSEMLISAGDIADYLRKEFGAGDGT